MRMLVVGRKIWKRTRKRKKKEIRDNLYSGEQGRGRGSVRCWFMRMFVLGEERERERVDEWKEKRARDRRESIA